MGRACVLAIAPMWRAGDRSLAIGLSGEPRFKSNETVVRYVARRAGMPWLPSSVTLSGNAGTVSPFVTLAAG